MEAAQQLSDSFSHAWLRCADPSSGRLGDVSPGHSFGASSFIDMDPDAFFSMRWTTPGDFDFAHPGSRPSPPLVHADELFSDGRLLPGRHLQGVGDVHGASDAVQFGRSLSRMGLLEERGGCAFLGTPLASSSSSPRFFSAQSTPASSVSSCSSAWSGGEARPPRLAGRCRGSPGKILLRYLCFVVPLYRKVRALQLFSRKSTARPAAPPSSSSMEWCHGNGDTAVHDAILYCKKSIGQDI